MRYKNIEHAVIETVPKGIRVVKYFCLPPIMRGLHLYRSSRVQCKLDTGCDVSMSHVATSLQDCRNFYVIPMLFLYNSNWSYDSLQRGTDLIG